MFEPWPHQRLALDALRASLLAGHRRPMLGLPTGSGKTGLAAMIVDNALRKGNRLTFTVPVVGLVNQTVDRFVSAGIAASDIGVIQQNHPLTDWSKPVQVASIQTLRRRPGLPKSDVVVIDEAHLWHEFYGQWMGLPEWQRVPFIGLSATPWTPVLGRHYDDLIIGTTIRQLIAEGFLSRFRVFAPSHPDLSGVRTVAGDYHEGELASTMDKPSLVADAVENWRKHGENRPTLCFAVNRAHARSLQQQFEASGVPSAYIDAYTPLAERDVIGQRLNAGEIKVVCNVATMTTGIDLDVRCIVLCRPTKSEMLFCQIIGRGLRTAPDKLDCAVFDHSDTHARLGFVTDVDEAHTSLGLGAHRRNDSKRERPATKECPKCHFVEPAKPGPCTCCGFRPTRQNKVEHADGELREIGGTAAARRHHVLAITRDEHQRWFSAFVTMANQRGRNPGWVHHAFNEKFGRWPDRELHHREGPVGADIQRWVTSRNIRFHRRRA